MLIVRYPRGDAAELARIDAGRASRSELFVGDDGAASVLLSDTVRVPAGGVAEEVEVLFSGGQFGRASGDWLFLVGLWTTHEFRNEFLAWYKLEHMPILLECPLWSGCRFVEEKNETGCQFHALHQLADRAALDSPERLRSRATPWFARLAREPWFDGAFVRSLYKRAVTDASQAPA